MSVGRDRKQLPLDGGHREPSVRCPTLKLPSVRRVGNLTHGSMANGDQRPPTLSRLAGHAVVSKRRANVKATHRPQNRPEKLFL